MSTHATIKQLVIAACVELGHFPEFEELTARVREHFPSSKWQRSHYNWYKSQIKSGRIAITGLAATTSPPTMPDSPYDREKRLAQTLDNSQRQAAMQLLNYVRSEIAVLSAGDAEAEFRIRRFIHARLQLDGRPPKDLQLRKHDEQAGRCYECKELFEQVKGTHLHRLGAGGYVAENTVLLHPACHTQLHRRLGIPPE